MTLRKGFEDEMSSRIHLSIINTIANEFCQFLCNSLRIISIVSDTPDLILLDKIDTEIFGIER